MVKTIRATGVAISAMALLASGVPISLGEEGAAKRDKPRPAKRLVVVVGESNAGGYAVNSDATAAELEPRPAVMLLNNKSLKSFDPLDIGTNNLVGHTGMEHYETHGFELMLAERAEQGPAEERPAYLVKAGHGGSKIAQWAPDGEYHQTFLKRTAAATELLKDETLRPAIFWSLGINDAIAPTHVGDWKPAVIAHFENLRKVLGAETPIIITQLMPNYGPYNAAILEICQKVPNTYSVETRDAPLRDAYHWSYAGMKMVTGRMLDILDEHEKKSKPNPVEGS